MSFLKFIQWLRPGTILLGLWFLVPLISIDGVAAEAFVSGIGLPAMTAQPDLMSSIVSRDMDGNVVLKKAAMIFQDKLAQSDALQEAALDLIHNCKAAKEMDDGKLSHEKIDLAKKLYAIRATLADLTGASVEHPSSCTDLTGTRHDTWYSLWRSYKGDSQAQHDAVNGCIKSLFASSNSWISYKTHGQDANTLCDVPGTDNAARLIMDLLNDVNTIIPDWLNAFHAEQQESAKVLERRREILENIVELEQQIQHERLQDHQNAKATTSDILDRMDARIANMVKVTEIQMSQMGSDASRLEQHMISLSQGLETVQQGSQDIYGRFHDTFVDGLALQKQSIMDINKAAAEVIASYQFTNTEVIAQSMSFAEALQTGMQKSLDLQQEGLVHAGEMLQLQLQTMARQQESLAFANKLSATVANVAGVFEKAVPALQHLADTFSNLVARVMIVGVSMLVIMHQALFHSALRGFMAFCLIFATWYFFQTIHEFGGLTHSWAVNRFGNIQLLTAQNDLPSLGWLIAGAIALVALLMLVVRVFLACRSRLLREGLEDYFDQNEKSQYELERGCRGMTAPL